LNHGNNGNSKMIKFNLTSQEQKELKRRCKLAGLSFKAQAARPATARQLLNDRRLDA